VGLRLGVDNRTRWSSWHQVIDRAIRKKDKIQSFMSDYEEAIGDNRLLGRGWELLGRAHTFLQPFASATLYAEGDDSSISQSLMLMDMLLLHYEEQQVLFNLSTSSRLLTLYQKIQSLVKSLFAEAVFQIQKRTSPHQPPPTIVV
jgi:hypothetical protein